MALLRVFFPQQDKHLFSHFRYEELRLDFQFPGTKKKKEQPRGKNPRLDDFSLNANRTDEWHDTGDIHVFA